MFKIKDKNTTFLIKNQDTQIFLTKIIFRRTAPYNY